MFNNFGKTPPIIFTGSNKKTSSTQPDGSIHVTSRPSEDFFFLIKNSVFKLPLVQNKTKKSKRGFSRCLVG